MRESEPADPRARAEAAYRCFEREVFAFALRLVAGRREEAEDVVQDVFLRLIVACDRAQSTPSLAWLRGVARNVVRERRRREQRLLPLVHLSAESALVELQVDDDPIVELQRKETERILKQALDGLPAGSLEILRCSIEGRTMRSIAEERHQHLDRIESALRRARTVLRSSLHGVLEPRKSPF